MSALKFKIASLDGLDETTRGLYRPSGNRFILDIDAEPGSILALKAQAEDLLIEQLALRAALTAKKSEAGAAALAETQRAYEAEIEAGALKSEPLEQFVRRHAPRLHPLARDSAEWKAELAKILAEAEPVVAAERNGVTEKYEARATSMRAVVEHATVASISHRLTATLAKKGCGAILEPHIAQRIRTTWRDDECVAEIVDANGQVATENELMLEFREMRPEFAAVVAGASADEKAVHARKVAEMMGGSAATKH